MAKLAYVKTDIIQDNVDSIHLNKQPTLNTQNIHNIQLKLLARNMPETQIIKCLPKDLEHLSKDALNKPKFNSLFS